jgi:general secretion pathway protein G
MAMASIQAGSNNRMKHASQRGFTLVEMMVVLTILLILLTFAMPIYSQSLTRAREDNLRKNVTTLNQMIAQYTLDKKRAPHSLEDLHSAGYIESVPDDITGRPDTWETEEEEDSIMSLEQTEGGIIGVKSGSNAIALDGTPYSSW